MSTVLILIKRKYRSFVIPVIIVHVIQSMNLLYTGRYLSDLTIENLADAKVIGNTIYSIAITTTAYSCLWAVGITSPIYCRLNNKKLNFIKNIIVIYLLTICISQNKFSTQHLIKTIDSLVSNRYVILHTDPDLAVLGRFVKDGIELSDNHVVKDLYSKGYNVIILFCEGLSKEVISNSVTPNLTKFYQNAVSFNSYFNHAAATFRGLRGQLISSYQFLGGYNEGKGIAEIDKETIYTRYDNSQIASLISVLNDNKYHSVFFSPHTPNDNLATLMKTVGFKELIVSELSRSLSDSELLFRIINYLSELKNTDNFIICTYLVGTHYGLDSPDLKYGDGNNPYLNKFYNQDHWIGRFIEFFFNSSYSDNTVLIITTDHATYPTSDFRKTFNIDNDYFIDEIPLGIFKKSFYVKHGGAAIENGIKNSLSLAPTVLDILRIKWQDKNYFLGNSLLSNKNSMFDHYSAIGNTIFFIDSDKRIQSYNLGTANDDFSDIIKEIYKLNK